MYMKFIAGLIAGIIIAYFIWGNELSYVDAIKADQGNEFGAPYILTSIGNVQVAVIHGYPDNDEICESIRARFGPVGTFRACIPYYEAPYGTPWWHFWGKSPNKPS